MAKVVLLLIFVAATVLIAVQMIGARRGGPVAIELASSRLAAGDSVQGTLFVTPKTDVRSLPVIVELVARRRFSSPVETAEAAADYYHDTEDLHRSRILEVSSIETAAGETWQVAFQASIPADVPDAGDRTTNAPNLGGRTGTQPWTVEWQVQARVPGIDGRADGGLATEIFRVD